jgi:hypothetical protein
LFELTSGKTVREPSLIYLVAYLFIEIRPTNMIQALLYGTRTVSVLLYTETYNDDFVNASYTLPYEKIINMLPYYLFEEGRNLEELDEHSTYHITLTN